MSSQILQTKGKIFPTWENNLDKEPAKTTEIKKNVEQLGYKGKQ